ncbi:hypothetical protein BB558_001717 [Smittium angustum]|uniref:Uncharacterized protein n=1 Tax=Smittium angustum TaxID=133377 RepID=A0A2U1JAL1_SMIAN|nr:hypothetical protein BB558_007207 [Smittium angustum]PWA02152.1 hypothetical protein BB558_001717 [Smittium angustum]
MNKTITQSNKKADSNPRSKTPQNRFALSRGPHKEQSPLRANDPRGFQKTWSRSPSKQTPPRLQHSFSEIYTTKSSPQSIQTSKRTPPLLPLSRTTVLEKAVKPNKKKRASLINLDINPDFVFNLNYYDPPGTKSARHLQKSKKSNLFSSTNLQSYQNIFDLSYLSSSIYKYINNTKNIIPGEIEELGKLGSEPKNNSPLKDENTVSLEKITLNESNKLETDIGINPDNILDQNIFPALESNLNDLETQRYNDATNLYKSTTKLSLWENPLEYYCSEGKLAHSYRYLSDKVNSNRRHIKTLNPQKTKSFLSKNRLKNIANVYVEDSTDSLSIKDILLKNAKLDSYTDKTLDLRYFSISFLREIFEYKESILPNDSKTIPSLEDVYYPAHCSALLLLFYYKYNKLGKPLALINQIGKLVLHRMSMSKTNTKASVYYLSNVFELYSIFLYVKQLRMQFYKENSLKTPNESSHESTINDMNKSEKNLSFEIPKINVVNEKGYIETKGNGNDDKEIEETLANLLENTLWKLFYLESKYFLVDGALCMSGNHELSGSGVGTVFTVMDNIISGGIYTSITIESILSKLQELLDASIAFNIPRKLYSQILYACINSLYHTTLNDLFLKDRCNCIQKGVNILNNIKEVELWCKKNNLCKKSFYCERLTRACKILVLYIKMYNEGVGCINEMVDLASYLKFGELEMLLDFEEMPNHKQILLNFWLQVDQQLFKKAKRDVDQLGYFSLENVTKDITRKTHPYKTERLYISNPNKPLPLSLLNAAMGHPILVELKNGETYNGHLEKCDNFMNLMLREVIQTSVDGDRFWRWSEMNIRGNTIKYFRIPDPVLDKAKEEEANNRSNYRNDDRNRRGRGRGRGRGGQGGRGGHIQKDQ